ncbi:MAG: chemotaxis protein CheW [Hyphomicrobiaceae bacterium]|nr:chemotaxis protein CheW [Hyphomicrobiaceae bacterium]
MDELMEQFLIESRELVQQASDDLISLDGNLGDQARIDSAFRAMHTLKGSVAIFDFPPMLSALHAAEELLSAVRGHRVPADKPVLDALLQCVTASDAWIESIAATGALGPESLMESERLKALLSHIAGPSPYSRDPTVLSPSSKPEAPIATPSSSSAANRSLRIDGTQVDAVADVVGELIIAKNVLGNIASRAADVNTELSRALKANHTDMERLIGDLHRSVTRLRVVPLSRSFRRFPRLVRDMAGKLGKTVDLEIVGEEVEADKTIVDGLYEPLLHILRNALDHGIEEPVVRTAAGKSASGRIKLEARKSAGQITISVSDDGRGLEVEQIRRTALRKNMMTPSTVADLDEEAVVNLIFAPGFSTSSSVSEVSGRGVGMDAVKTSVEALSGRIAVTSNPGAGTNVTLILPLAVFVSTIMLVRAGEQWFGVPFEAVRETVRIPRDRVLPIKAGEAFSLRNRVLPLIQLSSLLGLPASTRPDNARILVVGSPAAPVGLEVEDFGERMEVHLRPVTGLLSGFTDLLGTALLGDGKVLMVLNISNVLGG